MALKSTIYKAEVQISDLDRHYYESHVLTLARHPSETEERLMVRLLAFILFASGSLKFGKGLSTEDEPDLLDLDDTGAIRRWIDVGLPEERALRKACGRAEEVVLLAYGGRVADLWWQQNESSLAAQKRLRVINLSPADTATLCGLVSRNMRLQCTIEDGLVWLADDTGNHEIAPVVLQSPA